MSPPKETEINLLRKAHSRERDKLDNILFLIAAGTSGQQSNISLPARSANNALSSEA